MKTKGLRLIVLLMVIIALAAASFQVASALQGAPEPLTPAANGTTYDGPRSLSAAETATITNLMLADANFKSLVEGKTYTIKSINLWLDQNGQKKIGGKATIAFGQPQVLTGPWRSIEYGIGGAYTTKSGSLELLTAGLFVGVDLNTRQVVELIPFSPQR